MTKSVWKYPVPIADYFVLEMPRGAEILYLDEQQKLLCLWALVQPGAAREKRAFRLAGTGHPILENNLDYVDSLVMLGGDLVFHLFEIKNFSPDDLAKYENFNRLDIDDSAIKENQTGDD